MGSLNQFQFLKPDAYIIRTCLSDPDEKLQLSTVEKWDTQYNYNHFLSIL
jgi:hypothetical protein